MPPARHRVGHEEDQQAPTYETRVLPPYLSIVSERTMNNDEAASGGMKHGR